VGEVDGWLKKRKTRRGNGERLGRIFWMDSGFRPFGGAGLRRNDGVRGNDGRVRGC